MTDGWRLPARVQIRQRDGPKHVVIPPRVTLGVDVGVEGPFVSLVSPVRGLTKVNEGPSVGVSGSARRSTKVTKVRRDLRKVVSLVLHESQRKLKKVHS